MDDDIDRASVLSRLSDMLDSMGESKVTLIGDVMLDRFHHGYANNLDSTAPVPVLKIMRTEETPGAAAHIALGLRSLGMQVSLHCCVGDDREGRTIVTKLSEPNSSEILTSSINKATAYLLLCGLVMAIFRFVWRYFLMGTARRIEKKMREKYFEKLQNLPMAFFNDSD